MKSKWYSVIIIILLLVCVFEAGIIIGLPKIEYKTITETKVETEEMKSSAIWVVESIENGTIYCDIYRYNKDYDIYFRINDSFVRHSVWSNGSVYGINYAIQDFSNPYDIWGTVVDYVQVLSPNLWNIGEDGYYFENLRDE